MWFRVELNKKLLIIINTINVIFYNNIIILLKIRFPSKNVCVSISQTKSDCYRTGFSLTSRIIPAVVWVIYEKKTHKHTFFEQFQLRKMHHEVKKVNRNVFSDPVNRF